MCSEAAGQGYQVVIRSGRTQGMKKLCWLRVLCASRRAGSWAGDCTCL